MILEMFININSTTFMGPTVTRFMFLWDADPIFSEKRLFFFLNQLELFVLFIIKPIFFQKT